jgi:hypothetical protein
MAILGSQLERQAPGAQPPFPPGGRHEYAMPTPSPLGAERPDLHGI